MSPPPSKNYLASQPSKTKSHQKYIFVSDLYLDRASACSVASCNMKTNGTRANTNTNKNTNTKLKINTKLQQKYSFVSDLS